MSGECSVQVGVRIRPFNDREKALGAKLCVEMEGPMTRLLPPDDADAKNKEPKKFTFDASFWSHDGFELDASGYAKALPGTNYADQRVVFEAFGKKVLDNAWEGYHCCLFAYGQTGAGKSYSMTGYGANRGIVPISCEEIFKRIEANTDPGLGYEVVVSMVEIYNEQVQDLLIAPKLRPKKGLEIRESQQLGIYIAGVSKRHVVSYQAIERVTDEGTQNRTVGSTLMNATSSRAHTVVCIEFKQVSKAAGASGEKVSLINLVDLAGSEKAGQTGASGDRLKEGCAINKSLSALGNVIEKLADKATGKAKANAIVPYRDSKLTRLLQNALGGSSKTIMICAISPASSNHEETLSTLRYADRAKRIKNTAIVNENPQDKLIRQLREENAKLRDMLDNFDNSSPTVSAPQIEGNEEALRLKQAEISALEEAIHEMGKTYQERFAEAQEKAAQEQERREKEKVDLSLPHLSNLNEDQLLTNKLQFPFKKGCTRIGRAGAEEVSADDMQVELAGPGIQPEHAIVVNGGSKCVLSAMESAVNTTFVNGKNPKPGGEGIPLAHGDRIVFGQLIFVFVYPEQGSADELLTSGQVSYTKARKEFAGVVAGPSEEEMKASRQRAEELELEVQKAEEAKERARIEAELMLKQREEEFNEKMAALEAEWNSQLRATQQAKANDKAVAEERAMVHDEQVQKMKKEFEDRQNQAEEAIQKKAQELEQLAKKAAAAEQEHRQHEVNIQRLEEQLKDFMPLIKEANIIAAELNRPYSLKTKLHIELGGGRSQGSINVMAEMYHDKIRLFDWTPETLETRVFLMRELQFQCDEEGPEVATQLTREEDPFWDPVEVERLIGVAQILLEGLLLQVENGHSARILGPDGKQAGTLCLELWPLGADGTLGVPDAECVEDPEDLLGTRMGILLKVLKATGLPEALANDVRVEYEYFIDEKPRQVPPVPGHSVDPVFNYQHTFVQDPVTSRFMEYLRTKYLVFRVYGRDTAAASFKQNSDAAAEAAKALAIQAAEAEAVAATYMEDSTREPHFTTTTGMSAIEDPGNGNLQPNVVEPNLEHQLEEVEEVDGSAKQYKSVPALSTVRRLTEADPNEGPVGGNVPEKRSKACVIL